MATVTVSIGRNVGTGTPLPIDQWRSFRAQVEGEVTDAAEVVYFAGLGGGVFEGVFEESATWVAEIDVTAEALWRLFRRTLANLAARFGQESIAVTIGTTELVEAAVAKQAAVAR